MNIKDIVIPEEYQEKSRQITMLWEAFIDTGENLDKLILETRTLLENLGFSRTDAMKKIAHDHKHLKGFSLPSLYRMLPKEEKQYQAPKGRDDSHHENDIKITTNVNVIDVEIPEPDPNEEPLENEPEYLREENTEEDEQDSIIQRPPMAQAFPRTEALLKQEKEFYVTEQLLREERAKTSELQERVNLRDIKIHELDSLTDTLSRQMQELDRQLIAATTIIADDKNDENYELPKPEHNYTLFADVHCGHCGSFSPQIIRVFKSGKIVAWVEKKQFIEKYGKEPQE